MMRKRSFFLLLSAMCVALLMQLTPSLADKRVALVIGNAQLQEHAGPGQSAE